MSKNVGKPSNAEYPVAPADLANQQNRLKKAAAAGANALKSPGLSVLSKQLSSPPPMPQNVIASASDSPQVSATGEEAPKPEQALAAEIPANREAIAATAMNDNEAILVELRKISAWAERQRKVTKWSLVFLAVFIPALVGFTIMMEQRVSAKFEDTAPSQKPDWYEVERNARLGDFDKATGMGEELIVKTPQSPDAHKRLAGAYLAAGKLDKAREHYAEAFRLFPSEENEKQLTAIDKRISAEKP